MLEAQFGKDSSYRLVSCAVEGCVYNLDIIRHLLNHFGMDDLLFQFHHIGVVDFGTNYLVQARRHGSLFVHGQNIRIIGHSLYFIDDFLVFGSRNLSAVFPVNLIAIIFRRIMACRYHNTGNAAQCTQSEGKLWCGSEFIKHICLDAVGRQTKCRHIREFRGHETGIVSNGNALLFSALFFDEIGKALCCLSYRINIHAVGSRAYHSAQSSGSEFQILIKTILDFRIVSFDAFQFLFGLLVKIIIFQPEFVFLHISHVFLLLFCRSLQPSILWLQKSNQLTELFRFYTRYPAALKIITVSCHNVICPKGYRALHLQAIFKI